MQTVPTNCTCRIIESSKQNTRGSRQKLSTGSIIILLFKFKDPVLSIMHCALQKSAAIFLMLKIPVGLN